MILAMINAGHNVSVFFTDVSHHSMAGVVDFSANLSMSEIAPLPYVYYLALTKAWPIQWAIATFTHHR